MPYSWIKMYLMKKKYNKIRNYSYRQTNKRFVQRSKRPKRRYTNRQVQTNRQTDRQMYTCPKDRTKQTETQSTDKRRINIDLSLTAHSVWMLRLCYRFRGGRGVRQTARHTQTIKQISTDFCQIDDCRYTSRSQQRHSECVPFWCPPPKPMRTQWPGTLTIRIIMNSQHDIHSLSHYII